MIDSDSGDEQHHAETDDFPGDRDHDRPEGEIGGGEPDDRLVNQAQVDQEFVQEPNLFVEQPEPQETRTRQADHDGEESDGAGEPLQRRVLDREQRERKSEAHQDRRQHKRVFGGELERAPEARVVPDPPIVGQADEFAAAEQRPVGQRYGDQLAERDRHEHPDEQQGWRHEQPARPLRKGSTSSHR